MLQRSIRPHVQELDDFNYRVVLKDNLNYFANYNFTDGEYWSTAWLRSFWEQVFVAKSSVLGRQSLKGFRVLDCCCGQGDLGETLQKHFEVDPLFVDLSEKQLRAAAMNFNNTQTTTRPKFCVADTLSLPFATESFDLVVGNSFLHHLPDVIGGLAEIKRVLKPGGKCVLFHEPGSTAVFWESFPLSLVKDTNPTVSPLTDLWVFSERDLNRLAVDAGFSRVDVLGTGILAAMLLNWYLLLALKLNWRSRFTVYPVYCLRVWLLRLELALQRFSPRLAWPSLLLVASREVALSI